MRKGLILLVLLLGGLMSLVAQPEAQKHYAKGILNFKAGNYERAVDEFTQTLAYAEKKMGKRQTYIKRGLAHNQLRNFDAAVADFSRAIEMDPDELSAYIDRGISFMYGGKYSQAKEDFSHVLENGSTTAFALPASFYIAKVIFFQREFKEALLHCESYLAVNPEDEEGHFLKGEILRDLGRLRDAINAFDKAVALSPFFKEAIFERGKVRVALMEKRQRSGYTHLDTEKACADFYQANQLGVAEAKEAIRSFCNRKRNKKKKRR